MVAAAVKVLGCGALFVYFAPCLQIALSLSLVAKTSSSLSGPISPAHSVLPLFDLANNRHATYKLRSDSLSMLPHGLSSMHSACKGFPQALLCMTAAAMRVCVKEESVYCTEAAHPASLSDLPSN